MPRVLLYEDPVTDCHGFMWRTPHITLDAAMYKALPGWERRMMLNKHFASLALRNGLEKSDLIPVDEADWVDLLADPQDNINTLFNQYHDVLEGSAPSDPAHHRQQLALNASRKRQEAAMRALKGFQPDIIVTWVPVPFLRALFPDALILHRESGLFTRAPFPSTYYLDPCGLHQWSWPARFAETASQAPKALAQIDRLRDYYGALFKAVDPYANLTEQLRPFRKTVLVATQVSDHFSIDSTCGYRSPFHLLLDVLQNAPADCAVLLGQHPSAKPLRADELAWLRERFPNFIHRPDFMGREGVSQYLLLHADAIATVSSTVGWQGAFWGKPLIALGRSQLNRFAQAEKAAAVASLIDGAAPDTSPAAAWLAFHYCIPASLLENPDWLAAYLTDRLEHWRRHGPKGYYDRPCADPEAIATAFITDPGSMLGSLVGPPLSASSGEDLIDFRDDRRFGAGWSFCEQHGKGNSYRWIEGTMATVRLALSRTQSCKISLRLATHALCPGQTVTVGVGDTILATAKVFATRRIDLGFTVPEHLAKPPVMQLWLRAQSAATPPGDERNLSLICHRIAVTTGENSIPFVASMRRLCNRLSGKMPLRTGHAATRQDGA